MDTPQVPHPVSIINYPKITLTVDGQPQTYELKFRNSDIVRLKKEHGIDLLGETETVKGALALERMHILLQAAICHEAKIELETIANSIDFADFPIYTAALRDAQKKALEQISRLVDELSLKTEPSQEAPKPAVN